jgi:hypothetical protein
MHRLRCLATAAALAIGVAQSPVAASANEGGHGGGGHFSGGMRSEAGTSAQGIRSQVGTSIRASIGNSVDSGAAPYSASAAFFLATTSVTVSVTVTRATTLLGIARSTLTATTLPWAATIRIRILVRRINGGLVT